MVFIEKPESELDVHTLFSCIHHAYTLICSLCVTEYEMSITSLLVYNLSNNMRKKKKIFFIHQLYFYIKTHCWCMMIMCLFHRKKNLNNLKILVAPLILVENKKKQNHKINSKINLFLKKTSSDGLMKYFRFRMFCFYPIQIMLYPLKDVNKKLRDGFIWMEWISVNSYFV